MAGSKVAVLVPIPPREASTVIDAELLSKSLTANGAGLSSMPAMIGDRVVLLGLEVDLQE